MSGYYYEVSRDVSFYNVLLDQTTAHLPDDQRVYYLIEQLDRSKELGCAYD
jgi:hypothetical protein